MEDVEHYVRDDASDIASDVASEAASNVACLLNIQMPRDENVRLDFAPRIGDQAGDLEGRIRCSLRRLLEALKPCERVTIDIELRVGDGLAAKVSCFCYLLHAFDICRKTITKTSKRRP